MKYIKFLEAHSSKVHVAGDVAMIPKASLSAWMDTGIVEEVKEKDYKSFRAAQVKAVENADKKRRANALSKEEKLTKDSAKAAKLRAARLKLEGKKADSDEAELDALIEAETHLEDLNEMSVEELKAYIEENELEVELGKDELVVESLSLLIVEAEEAKKKDNQE